MLGRFVLLGHKWLGTQTLIDQSSLTSSPFGESWMGNKKPPKISLPNHHQSSIEEETFQPLPKRLKTYQLPRFGQTVWPFGLYRGGGNECSTTIWSFVTSTWEGRRRRGRLLLQLRRIGTDSSLRHSVSTLLKHVFISTYYRLYKNTRGPSYSDLVDLEKVVPKVQESFSSFPASIRIARSTFERCPSTFHPKR